MSGAGDVYPMWKFYLSAIAVAALRPELIRQGFEIEKGNGRQALSERRRME
jgi:hypothetical protein